MELKNPMLVVTDMDKTVAFYKNVLGLQVVMEKKTFLLIECKKEDEFDKFADNLRNCNVQYVHPVKEHAWGQRVVRFYDPDRHIIEVGENMKTVCKRFIDSGMTPEQTAERMDVPIEYVRACIE